MQHVALQYMYKYFIQARKIVFIMLMNVLMPKNIFPNMQYDVMDNIFYGWSKLTIIQPKNEIFTCCKQSFTAVSYFHQVKIRLPTAIFQFQIRNFCSKTVRA